MLVLEKRCPYSKTLMAVVLAAFLFCGCSARYHSFRSGDHRSKTISIRFADKTDVSGLKETFPIPGGGVAEFSIGKAVSEGQEGIAKAVTEGAVRAIVKP